VIPVNVTGSMGLKHAVVFLAKKFEVIKEIL
jgi:hypothetical protein